MGCSRESFHTLVQLSKVQPSIQPLIICPGIHFWEDYCKKQKNYSFCCSLAELTVDHICAPTARTSGVTSFISLHLCKQILERNNIQDLSWLTVSGAQSLVAWLHAMDRRSWQWEDVGRAFSPHGGQTEESEEIPGVYTFQGHALSDLFLPGRSHLLNFHSLPK